MEPRARLDSGDGRRIAATTQPTDPRARHRRWRGLHVAAAILPPAIALAGCSGTGPVADRSGVVVVDSSGEDGDLPRPGDAAGAASPAVHPAMPPPAGPVTDTQPTELGAAMIVHGDSTPTALPPELHRLDGLGARTLDDRSQENAS